MRRAFLAAAVAWVVTYLLASSQLTAGVLRQERPGSGPQSLEDSNSKEARLLLDRYCVTCHNQQLKTAQLMLDRMNLAEIGSHADIWEKAVRKVRGGLMPPAGRPRPDEMALDKFAGWVEGELDRAASERPDPGRTETLHRLNRTEYRNAIRDLLALDVDISAMLPADDAGSGFDNIAGVLKLNQSLMERYLTTARRISRLAVGSTLPAPASDTFRLSDEALQYSRVEGLPFGTRGGTRIPYNFAQGGEYEIGVEFMGSKVESAGYDAGSGFPDPHQLEITIDGARAHLATLEPKPLRRLDGTAESGIRVRVPVTAGPHEVGVTFLKLPTIEEVDGPRRRLLKPHFQSFMVPPNLAVYQPFVGTVSISGPFNAIGAGTTPSRERIFTCRPTGPEAESSCAKKIVSTLARRAYRRPVTNDDVEALLKFYHQGRTEEGGGFDAGIEMALRRILTSVDFLFRVEVDRTGVNASKVVPTETGPSARAVNYRISDLALASRLSFFLWSSVPDDELLDLAARGRLSGAAVVEQQVRRMLADSKSDSLVNSFAVQWLQLRTLEVKTPDEVLFPNFDDSLREAFTRETVLFVDSILREDRSVLDLLRANYTFVNERLATHYGIPNIKGSHFRRVSLSSDSPRVGLLGQGSILTITSMPNRTSPVVRGKWILENILGSPPPDPPANVPPLPDAKAGVVPASMRERMAVHRSNPVCASCHSMIDPPGFAFENFDAVGRFREFDDAFKRIDASGALPDGSKFDGLSGFRAALLKRPDRFVTAFTEKLLTYALGRSLLYSDMPAVRKIVRQAALRDYKISAVILGVVRSVPFEMRRSES